MTHLLEGTVSIYTIEPSLTPLQLRDFIVKLIENNRVVFTSYEAFSLIRERHCLATLLMDRLVVVIVGCRPAICYVDGIAALAGSRSFSSRVHFENVFLNALMNRRNMAEAFGSIISQPAFRLKEGVSFRAESGAYKEIIDATGVFVFRDGRLLVARKNSAKAIEPGVLYLPGGKIKSGERPEQCARRELFEETSLKLGEFTSVGVLHFEDPANPERLFRFHEFVAIDTQGEATARDDIVDCFWKDVHELSRGEVFASTWVQLWLLRLTLKNLPSLLGQWL